MKKKNFEIAVCVVLKKYIEELCYIKVGIVGREDLSM